MEPRIWTGPAAFSPAGGRRRGQAQPGPARLGGRCRGGAAWQHDPPVRHWAEGRGGFSKGGVTTQKTKTIRSEPLKSHTRGKRNK